MLILIKGTRAVQMLTGLAIIGIFYFISMRLGLLTVHEILSRFFSYLFIIVIIIFQDDVRRVLTNVGKTPFFRMLSSAKADSEKLVEELVKACVALSRKRIGALIVLEKSMGLKNFIEVGIQIDSKVNAELVVSIFIPASPIHDGAIIISEGKIIAAGCFLPLTRNPNVERSLGTRHRAAIGLTEETDSVVVVVSEEQREISVAVEGELTRGLDGPALRRVLNAVLGIEGTENE
ncbi:MAG: diadenylate cyclase CdaA [Oligoflexia bacterium]|nr:diadenylate cyclase CdaA [Oligoflexia bacterium]